MATDYTDLLQSAVSGNQPKAQSPASAAADTPRNLVRESVSTNLSAPPQKAAPDAEKTDYSDLLRSGVSGNDASPVSRVAGSDAIFKALLHQESGGKQFDKNGKPLESTIIRNGVRVPGAIGIAQVMEGTGPTAAALAGLPWDRNRWANDQDYNATIGRAYFNKQLETFGEPAKALAAYNAGPGAMQRAQTRANSLGTPGQWLNFMPEETRKYVPSILARAGTVDPAPSTAVPSASLEPDKYNPYASQRWDTAPRTRLDDKLGLMDTAKEGFKGGFTSSQALSAQVGALILNTAGVQKDLQKSLLEYADGKNQQVSEATGGVSSFTDAIGPDGDLPRWFANSAGYLGYQIGESILTGGMGAIVGKTIGKTAVSGLAKGMVEKEIGTLAAAKGAENYTKEQISAMAASKVAAKLGAASSIFANNIRQEGGSIYGDAVDQAGKTGEPVDIGRVWLSSLTAAGVDTAAEVMMAKGLLGIKEGSTAATGASSTLRLCMATPSAPAVPPNAPTAAESTMSLMSSGFLAPHCSMPVCTASVPL